MEKFKELVSLCKASVELSVNDHKGFYESVEQFISEEDRNKIDVEVFNEMVKRDTIVKIRAYPVTAIGFIDVYHYDIDMAVDIALKDVKKSS